LLLADCYVLFAFSLILAAPPSLLVVCSPIRSRRRPFLDPVEIQMSVTGVQLRAGRLALHETLTKCTIHRLIILASRRLLFLEGFACRSTAFPLIATVKKEK
jgi:hypothetical protein